MEFFWGFSVRFFVGSFVSFLEGLMFRPNVAVRCNCGIEMCVEQIYFSFTCCKFACVRKGAQKDLILA